MWGTGRGLILPPFGFKTNKGSKLGKSRFARGACARQNQAGLATSQIDVVPAPLLACTSARALRLGTGPGGFWGQSRGEAAWVLNQELLTG